MPYFRIQIRERHRLMILLFAGLMLSVLFLWQVGDDLQERVKDGGHTFAENLESTLTTSSDQGGEGVATKTKLAVTEALSSLPAYILRARIWLPVLCLVLSFTAWGAAALYLLWVCLGFSVGALLWAVVAGGGWRGPFYCWALIFPQYLWYVPALLLLYAACLRWNRFWRERGCHLGVTLSEPQLRLFVLRIFLGILLYGLGIWTEININPWILRKIFIIS